MHFVSKILAALLCILLAASPAGSGSMMLLGVGKAAAGGGSPAYTFIGQANNAGSGTSVTQAFNLGGNSTCTAVVSMADAGGGVAPTVTVTVGGISLVQDQSKGDAGLNRFAAIFSKPLASCSGSQSVVLNASAAVNLTMWVYVLTGLASSTVVQTSGFTASGVTITPPTPTISVTAGDLLFVSGNGNSSPAYSNFTQVPTSRSGFDGLASAGDETVTSTNASFALTPTGTDQVVPVATYH